MWRQVDPDSREIRASTVQVTQTTSGETSDPLTADRLAFAWIYGDTVHADATLQAEGQPFGINERYRAATGIVAELIINTVATLNVIWALHNDDLFTVPDENFERAVVVDQTEFRQEAELWQHLRRRAASDTGRSTRTRLAVGARSARRPGHHLAVSGT